MALSLPNQWTLVACGVIAHADGVLDGEECDRLMSMVEQEVDGEEYSSWMAIISDPRRLDELLEGLEPPPAQTHREILEQAWVVSIVDGERTQPEEEALQRVAKRLGVEPMQLDFWRQAWSQAQDTFAEATARTLAAVIGAEGTIATEDRKLMQEIIWRLPTSHEQRDELGVLAAVSQPLEQVVASLDALPMQRRAWLLKLIAPAVAASTDPDATRERFVDIAQRVGFDPERAQRMLEG